MATLTTSNIFRYKFDTPTVILLIHLLRPINTTMLVNLGKSGVNLLKITKLVLIEKNNG